MDVHFNVLSYGENVICTHNTNELGWTIHAEDSALRKLPTYHKKRLKKVDLIVIRTSKTGVLGISKPCIHCIKLLNESLPNKGYSLQKVYYTDEGNVKQTTLKKLMDETPHLSRFTKERMERSDSSSDG